MLIKTFLFPSLKVVTHPPRIINGLKIAITHTHTHTVLAEGNLLLSLTVQYMLTPVSY